MGAITGSYQLTIHTLTPDGLGPFWWAAKDQNDNAYQINYFDQNSGTVENAANLFAFDTFWDLLVGMNANNISINQVEVNINVEEVSDLHGLQSHFNPPLLTNTQLGLIVQNFDHVELCKKFGAYRLVQRFYLQGHFTLLQLSDVLLYLGQTNKVQRSKVHADLTILLNNGDITQQQFDDFFTDWDNIVGTNL